jgi:hypothetical protein
VIRAQRARDDIRQVEHPDPMQSGRS